MKSCEITGHPISFMHNIFCRIHSVLHSVPEKNETKKCWWNILMISQWYPHQTHQTSLVAGHQFSKRWLRFSAAAVHHRFLLNWRWIIDDCRYGFFLVLRALTMSWQFMVTSVAVYGSQKAVEFAECRIMSDHVGSVGACRSNFSSVVHRSWDLWFPCPSLVRASGR